MTIRASDELTARLRERLARAGLLSAGAPKRGPRPRADALASARAAAASGTTLSRIVSTGRG